jgi:RNA polymerase sigma factor (sigma-70 family)
LPLGKTAQQPVLLWVSIINTAILNVEKFMRALHEKPRTTEGIGNPETWVDLYGDSLFHYALFRTADKAIAEELVQETFVAALATFGKSQFRGDSAGKTWMIGILKHKILDHLRKKYRHQAQSLEDINNNEIEDSFDARGSWRVKPGQWAMGPYERYNSRNLCIFLSIALPGLTHDRLMPSDFENSMVKNRKKFVRY